MALDAVAGLIGVKRASAPEGDRSVRARLAIVVLAVMLAATVLFSLASGASDASAFAVIRDWLFPSFSAGDALSMRDSVIIYDIRLPRVIMGVLIGAALAVSGAVMQGLFRNPLADPGLVGVSAGASLGAVAVIVLGATVLSSLTALFGSFTLPLAAFAGGLATTLVLYGISTRQGRTSVATMLLAGIALAAMAMAFTGMLIFMADDRQLRDLTFWSLWFARRRHLAEDRRRCADHRCRPFSDPVPCPGSQRAGARRGNRKPSRRAGPAAEICGDRRGLRGRRRLGRRQRRHRLRRHRGAASAASADRPGQPLLCCRHRPCWVHRCLLLADAVSRTIVAPAELPIGIVTATVGGPFFLWILLRRRGILDL